MLRKYSFTDRLLMNFNTALQTIYGCPQGSDRKNPAADLPHSILSQTEQRTAANLMRVNHAGEICAQALYQGQALTARSLEIRDQLKHAAQEENDHLAWCQQRLTELNSHISYLGPLWYTGSFAIGAIAGLMGDKISLGFLAETEYQVEQHLFSHLERLPEADQKSRKILEQMRQDEIQHAVTAEKAGAINLPHPIKTLMRYLSKVMTMSAYWF